MKRKNVLKFVSLLGIGSFVMLAAASCTQAITPVPKSGTTTSDPNATNPNSSNNGRDMTDNMSGVNSNPTNDQGMVDPSIQQLASAKKSLTDLLNTETTNITTYSDYAKIESALKSAYDNAKNVANNSDSTLENLKSAEASLRTALQTAATNKQTFDNENKALVTAYNDLKTTLLSKETTLSTLSVDKYSGIKDHVIKALDIGSGIISQKLDSIPGTDLAADTIVKADQDIKDDLGKLQEWMQNADKFSNYEKNPLSKTQITTGTGASNTSQQPGNYSFVAFSANPTSANTTPPGWNFAQRKVWGTLTAPLATQTTTGENQESIPLTDVSWIYNLNGMGTKYTLDFTYYGPSTGYLYFPYKLVDNSQSTKVGLQYKLNEGSETPISFMPTATSAQPASRAAEAPSSDQASDSNQNMAVATQTNPTPTVDDIKVAKITLTNLKFGKNTVEFSVPNGDNMVAPMIGNMYLTSNQNSTDEIYDSIFGNSLSDNNSVTVDILNGYSLSASYSIYVRQFTGLHQAPSNNPIYLVGYIGGSAGREDQPAISGSNRLPNTNGANRSLTVYVNAPKDGDYYVGGSYLTNQNRMISFSNKSTGEASSNSLMLNIMGQTDWNTLGKFDTSNNTNIANGSSTTNMTLNLKKGLNKIDIGGVSSGDTPYIGNLVFTLKNSTQGNAEPNQM
ncbi:hypothetical protein H3143_02940 [Mycoplasma tullyi]|uniref:Haemagglutinin Mycoplasma domain-containing protein n=1 Tax=Mycoplasma tullyi TaxID=1612150 RepID=A0A7D7U367_9MOLU|nr:hypothetical protein [Mycoplasma tullyi]QMT98431.1 hypothetical protein H3143_02940 [Mycoplasma tullyi]